MYFYLEVLRDGDLVNTTSTYTPVPEDRNSITLRCTDTIHRKWRVREDIIKSAFIRPHCEYLLICSINLNNCFQLNAQGSKQSFTNHLQ